MTVWTSSHNVSLTHVQQATQVTSHSIICHLGYNTHVTTCHCMSVTACHGMLQHATVVVMVYLNECKHTSSVASAVAACESFDSALCACTLVALYSWFNSHWGDYLQCSLHVTYHVVRYVMLFYICTAGCIWKKE